jgi:alginate O-acetyltransferase complex protein AlgJ
MNSKTLNIIFQKINITIFFVVIFSPCLWMICDQKTVFSFTEKRQLASFPPIPGSFFQAQKFFSDMDNYLNDHFGFREWMVYRYQREIRKRFSDVERLTKVLKGIDNWYFYTGDSLLNSILKDFTGKRLLSDNELREWVEAYRVKQSWLEKQGIQYLFIVPPNKMTVHGEFLGEPWIGQKGRTRFSQIKSILQESDKSTLLDLSPTLITKRHDESLYFKSDTHWTQYGAYLGYLAIAEKMESLFTSSRFKRDFTFSKTITRTCEKKKNNCGDLSNMILDYDSFDESFKVVDEFSSCAASQNFDYKFSDIDITAPTPYIAKSCRTGDLKVLVFRDSFFEALEPYFSENFKEVIYLWKDYDQKNIEELLAVFKPDIVIEERGERRL